jgi:hypothetical protein
MVCDIRPPRSNLLVACSRTDASNFSVSGHATSARCFFGQQCSPIHSRIAPCSTRQRSTLPSTCPSSASRIGLSRTAQHPIFDDM